VAVNLIGGGNQEHLEKTTDLSQVTDKNGVSSELLLLDITVKESK
jgi:hypothetical protein